MPVKKKKQESWLDFLPRGTKKRLADKYKITTTAVTYILRREDVVNHPEMVGEARDIALKAMELCHKHAKAVNHAISE
ncbi:hypothetical protein [Butyricimonas synergistica]|uniref:hypothetical protein n=1 Tax=Butyricimonas synergistica TaxID=544644 RepID=UPI0022DEA78C|nr:hypothetical protein [Butyricimonas synergistica]